MSIALSALALALLASTEPLAIVAHVLSGPEGALTSIQSGVLSASAYRADLAPMRDEESFARAELGAKIEDCADDDRCVSDRLSAIGARYGLVIVVNASRDFLGVELIDAELRRTLGQHLGTLPKEPLTDVIRDLVSGLFERAGFVESARLVLHVSPGGAAITIEGPIPRTHAGDLDALLEPGAVRAAITLEGYETQALEVLLERGKTTSANVELRKEESILASPWIWIGAAGLVAAGAITAVAIATAPSLGCVCLATPGEPCASTCP